MKKHTYTFSVAKPCAESWLQMTPTEKGNFCMNCQKEVIDFSSMKDEEIIHVIKNAKTSVCGRFRNTQLNRPMHLSYANVQRPYPIRIILAGIVALTLLQPVVSEASTKPVQQLVNVVSEASVENENTSAIPADSATVLRGRIFTAYDSMSVAYASIYVQGSSIKTTTDSTGRFTIALPDSLIGKSFRLEVIAVGLEKSYFNVSAESISSGKEQLFFLYEFDYVTDGIVIMDFEEDNPKKEKSNKKNRNR